MASSSPNHLFTIFLIALSIASLAHARESQFFSKATKETTTQVVVPNHEQQQEHQQQEEETLTKKQDQQQVDEPNFIPETTPNGYGLYGQESGQLSPSATAAEGRFPYKTTTSTARFPYKTTTSTAAEDRFPYKTTTSTTTTALPQESLYSTNYEQNNNYEQYKNNGDENSYYYNKDSYVTDVERDAGLGNRYTTTSTSLADRNTYNSGSNSYGSVKQEGMSDTRFMQNGKYFYDIDNEEKYHPNFRYGNTRTTSSRNNEYNPNMVNGGYYEKSYKNPNYEYNGNSMEEFGQNQEEFQEGQNDEFVP